MAVKKLLRSVLLDSDRVGQAIDQSHSLLAHDLHSVNRSLLTLEGNFVVSEQVIGIFY
jgi:hypothetical protein